MLSFFLALSLLAALVNSEPSNVTIDDEFGDEMTGLMPIYFPAEDWELGFACISCPINFFETPLDMSQIYLSTWHEATHEAGGGETTITVSFTGTTVYVYHIVANSIPDVTTLTKLSFVLDGDVVGEYDHTPDSSGTILYNVPVFVSTGLANTGHTLVIRGEGLESLLLFDYVMYTSEDGSDEAGGSSSLSSTSSSTSTRTRTVSTSTPDVPPSTSSPPSTSLTSTSSLPSIALPSLSSHNISFIPSQTPAKSIAPTPTVQTSSSSSPSTITPSPVHRSHVSRHAIVGATIGSITAFLLLCALLFYRIRRRNRGRGGHFITLNNTLNNGNEPATPVDDVRDEQETDSVLEIKHLSPIWKPLVPLPSHLARSQSASSGAAVTTVDAYGHSPEPNPEVRRRDGLGGRSLGKDIIEIREQLARFRARRGIL
ncbi:hypothetical protein V8D89_011886 [Ganoderma adspersum]